MDSSTYRHLMGQLKKSCLIPHHNFPSHNLLSQEFLQEFGDEFLESFPCYQPFPYVVQQTGTFYLGSGATDEARQFVKKKLSWERKLKTLKLPSINQAIKSLKELRDNKAVRLSADLRNYIHHFQNDPEPGFSGRYNWLYSGGCLSCEGCVLTSADFELNKPGLCILKLDKNEIQEKKFTKLKSHSPVLQISTKSLEDSLMVCVRQKNNLSFFKCNSSSQPIKLWRKKVAEGKLLTSSDLSVKHVVVIDSSHDLNVFLIETKTKIFGHSGKRLAKNAKDNWSQVGFGHYGIYWAYRKGFVILDIRDFSTRVAPDYFPSTTDTCENICAFIESPIDPNYIYLSTNHSVFQVDLRERKTVQRWTHLMKSPPQFMTAKGLDASEVIILQSHSVDEICGIINRCNVASSVSISLPCLLGSIRESFKLAQFHGLCLNPSVSKRVDFHITGLTCLKASDNFTLFTTNSGGDIFISKLTRKRQKDPRDAQQTLQLMKTFDCEKTSKLPKKLNLTDMSHVIASLKHPKSRKLNQTQKNYWRVNEMYDPESLMFCKDVLAKKILKVWGYNEESVHEDATMSVDDKVLEWMNKWCVKIIKNLY